MQATITQQIRDNLLQKIAPMNHREQKIIINAIITFLKILNMTTPTSYQEDLDDKGLGLKSLIQILEDRARDLVPAPKPIVIVKKAPDAAAKDTAAKIEEAKPVINDSTIYSIFITCRRAIGNLYNIIVNILTLGTFGLNPNNNTICSGLFRIVWSNHFSHQNKIVRVPDPTHGREDSQGIGALPDAQKGPPKIK